MFHYKSIDEVREAAAKQQVSLPFAENAAVLKLNSTVEKITDCGNGQLYVRLIQVTIGIQNTQHDKNQEGEKCRPSIDVLHFSKEQAESQRDKIIRQSIRHQPKKSKHETVNRISKGAGGVQLRRNHQKNSYGQKYDAPNLIQNTVIPFPLLLKLSNLLLPFLWMRRGCSFFCFCCSFFRLFFLLSRTDCHRPSLYITQNKLNLNIVLLYSIFNWIAKSVYFA